MSSGPVGLDTREYAYGYFTLTLSKIGLYTVSAEKNWLVTKVQLYTGALPGTLALAQSAILTGTPIPVAVNGCLTLEPNGAFRAAVQATGNGSLLIIEYWFQAQSGQAAQNIPINVASPP